MARGCEPTGPARPWIHDANRAQARLREMVREDDASIAMDLMTPIDEREAADDGHGGGGARSNGMKP
jgi:hypothetical protein